MAELIDDLQRVRQVADVFGEVEYLAVRAPNGAPIAKAGIDYAQEPDSGSFYQVVTRADLQGLSAPAPC